MMRRRELNERSPLRVLERSIHGGLGEGRIGVILARHGVGKTAFLVGVALDDLLRGRQVLHVSLDQPVDKVSRFYDEVFQDLAHAHELEDVWRARSEMEENRRIQHLPALGFDARKLDATLAFWKEQSEFTPAAILVEGYDLESASRDELFALRESAARAHAELWMSATVHRDTARDEQGIPVTLAAVGDLLDVILTMAHDGRSVHVGLLKDHDNPDVSELRLALDPRTMLLIEEPD